MSSGIDLLLHSNHCQICLLSSSDDRSSSNLHVIIDDRSFDRCTFIDMNIFEQNRISNDRSSFDDTARSENRTNDSAIDRTPGGNETILEASRISQMGGKTLLQMQEEMNEEEEEVVDD